MKGNIYTGGGKSVDQQTVMPSRKQRWKRWATKKWLFPALYLTTAAAVLSVMWFYDQEQQSAMPGPEPLPVQQTAQQWPSAPGLVTGETPEDPSGNGMVVNAAPETMQWPVADRSAVEQVLPFYQAAAKEPAMVTYQDTIRPHIGVDFARKDQKSFDVLAALSGTVKKAEKDPLAGGVVQLEHANGVTTVYQSLNALKVKTGQQIRQGEIIGEAGRNELEKKLGVHVHFEVRKNGEPVNPEEEMKKQQSGQP